MSWNGRKTWSPSWSLHMLRRCLVFSSAPHAEKVFELNTVQQARVQQRSKIFFSLHDWPVSYPFSRSMMKSWALASLATLNISSSEASTPYLMFSRIDLAKSTQSWLTTATCGEEHREVGLHCFEMSENPSCTWVKALVLELFHCRASLWKYCFYF